MNTSSGRFWVVAMVVGGLGLGIFLYVFDAVAGTPAAPTTVSSVPTYHNPVFRKDFPDPMVLRLGPHNYYAYGTVAGWDQSGTFPILHSTDLVHWTFVGNIFKGIPYWLNGDFWAPDVVKVGNVYHAYMVGKGSSVHCIFTARASSPTGPFHFIGLVSCGGNGGSGYIDPDLFIDRDGKAYLYVSVDEPYHTISVIPMKPDLIHPAGPARVLIGVTQAWEHSRVSTTVEGPFVVRRGATYVAFFSGNAFEANYAMGVATAHSPLGPFTVYPGNPILRGTKTVHGPGGGSVVTGPDGKLWLVYHAWIGKEGYENGGSRTMWIDPITWKGNIPSVRVTQ